MSYRKLQLAAKVFCIWTYRGVMWRMQALEVCLGKEWTVLILRSVKTREKSASTQPILKSLICQ